MIDTKDTVNPAKKANLFVPPLSPNKNPTLKLDDIELLKRTNNDGLVTEIRSVTSLAIHGGRNIVELQVPGSIGNVLQDMGRSPLIITLKGLLIGPDSAETLRSLKDKFESGQPFDLSSDIPLISELNKVVIEKFNVYLTNTLNLGASYSMILREFTSNSNDNLAESEPPSLSNIANQQIENKVSAAARTNLSV